MRQRRQPKQKAQRRRRQAQQHMWDSHRRLQERDLPCPAMHVKGPQKTAGASRRRCSDACGKVGRRLQGHDIPMLIVMSCSRCDLSFCPMDTSGAVHVSNQAVCLGITGSMCTSGLALKSVV